MGEKDVDTLLNWHQHAIAMEEGYVPPLDIDGNILPLPRQIKLQKETY